MREKGLYIGDLVLGANDGISTTFAVISGAAGAGLSAFVIIVLGLANLVADGISMGLSNYLSLRSTKAFQEKESLTFPASESKIIEGIFGHPLRHGLATGLAFAFAGALPLIPYFFDIPQNLQFYIAMAATAAALFTVGALRTLVTDAHWIRSGLEMLVVGGIAAIAAYVVGAIVKALFGAAI